jgi:hypothetical protein
MCVFSNTQKTDRNGFQALKCHPVRDWHQFADDPSFSNPMGVFYCVNPVHLDGRTDDDVADYRHVLVELEVSKKKRSTMTPEQLSDVALGYRVISRQGGSEVQAKPDI